MKTHYADTPEGKNALCMSPMETIITSRRVMVDVDCDQCLEILAMRAVKHSVSAARIDRRRKQLILDRLTSQDGGLTWSDSERQAWRSLRLAKEVERLARLGVSKAESRRRRQKETRRHNQARREKQLIIEATWEQLSHTLAERHAKRLVAEEYRPIPARLNQRNDLDIEETIRQVQAQLDTARTPEQFASILRRAPTRFSPRPTPQRKRTAWIVLTHRPTGRTTLRWPERLTAPVPPVYLPKILRDKAGEPDSTVIAPTIYTVFANRGRRNRRPSLSEYDSRGSGFLGMYAWEITT